METVTSSRSTFVTHHVSQTFCESVPYSYSETKSNATRERGKLMSAESHTFTELVLTSDAVFFRCSEHMARVIGT